MSQLKDVMKREIVEPMIQASRTIQLAKIVGVNKDSNTVDLVPANKATLDTIKGITILGSLGIKGEFPEVGDIAYVDFIDYGYNKAVVLAIFKSIDNIPNSVNFTGGSILKPSQFLSKKNWV